MNFYRNKEKDLYEWAVRPDKKPLILNGARQVGKTTLVKSFGEKNYGRVVYFNFEKQLEIHEFFKQSKDPKRIISNLNLTLDHPIDPRHSLIFFDEIQACGDALTALKYFQEEAKEYSIIAAGSLLGVSLGQVSFPVGKVQYMDLYPLSFEEYLRATSGKLHKAYLRFLEEPIGPIPKAFFNPLMELFKEYVIIGGMPEVISTYFNTKSLTAVKETKRNLLESYSSDFAKYTDKFDALKVGYIWDSLPSQLAKENKKFLYKVVRSGARAREYETALHWLTKAGLVIKAYNVNVPRLPLKSYNDLSAFKLYALDVGLLFEMSGLDPKNYLNISTLLTEFKSALTENYVAQALRAAGEKNLFYWESKGKAELDFLLTHSDKVIPIEVKSAENTKAKSLKVYQEKHNPELSIILSTNNLSLEGKNLKVPLFYAGHLEKLCYDRL